MTITWVSGCAALHSASTSSPLASGICRSVITRSYSFAPVARRASAPPATASTSYPARVRKRASSSRIERSSSTTRMLPRAAAPVMSGGLRSRFLSLPLPGDEDHEAPEAPQERQVAGRLFGPVEELAHRREREDLRRRRQDAHPAHADHLQAARQVRLRLLRGVVAGVD